MIQENEIVALVLKVGVVVFALVNRRQLAEMPAWGWMLASLLVMLAGRVLTVLEGFFLPDALNLAEHACYAGSSLLLAGWCWRAMRLRGAER